MNTMAAAKGRVLIVDDEYPVGKGICDLLEFLGFKAAYEQNPLKVESYLTLNPDVDVILLDINLGGSVNGLDLLSLIKEKNRYPQVIMFTSEEKLEVGVECMRRGAYDYMTKPFNEHEFMEKAIGAIERKKTLQLNDLYLGILFHDLKNPLQGIIGGIELLNMSLSPDTMSDLQKTGFRQAERSVNQILMLINNIVGVSKFESGSVCARQDSFQLSRAVDDTLAPFLDKADEPDSATVSVRYACASDLILNTDKDLFCRVLANIVSNALRFAANKSSVDVQFAQQPGELSVSVTNTGSYIEESAREAIFNKFSSVQVPSSQAGFKNFGLGLTFGKMAVEAMQGKIWITCDKELPSTTFHFTVKNYPA